ncbi:gamma-soluble NSF attachment protein [Octopus bimaculoides]|uniref:Gamma-soluble NSF attachment protein n=1 Tax=Octopus bimaculoides TaxID=37653 RepID=A0A0L8I0L2_OCTBM|nr:gamma-soluble NSF attachment protein [Octopus bimaculoides]|eukprot:XP_014768088.1 PREDICTED: gamma-soluble NSF attachment protein-like [Octopus bimaculoides]
MAMNEKKLNEGHAHMRTAENSQKTSLFKWKPDLEVAIEEYSKAAVCFRTCKAYDLAKNAYLKAAELQAQTNAKFYAGKSYEQVALLCKETKQLEQAAELLEKASAMFMEHGTPDSARLVLEKGAKMVEQEFPLKAVHMYKKASAIADNEDRPNNAAENIGKAARILIHQRKLEQSIEYLKKEIHHHKKTQNWPMIGKAAVGVILLYLHNEDFAGGFNFYEEHFKRPELSDSDDAVYMYRLLKAYDTADEAAGRAVLDSPLVRHMDNAFAKLARDLEIPEIGTSSQDWGPSPHDPIDEIAEATARLAADDYYEEEDEELDLL